MNRLEVLFDEADVPDDLAVRLYVSGGRLYICIDRRQVTVARLSVALDEADCPQVRLDVLEPVKTIDAA